jgi:Mg2+-importing ATPase
VARPRRWDIRFIQRFMLEFGLLSSVFDGLTFAVLLLWFRAPMEEFRTGWFVQSLLTELVIALVVRTRRVCFRSKPGTLLGVSTLVLSGLTLVLPYLPGVALLGFTPLPPALLFVIMAITAAYVVCAEALKQWFYRRVPGEAAEAPAKAELWHAPCRPPARDA